MIKQTLYFGNPAYLSLKNKQLCIRDKSDDNDESHTVTRAIEDIAVVILDHGQITITHQAIIALQDNKAAIISCDSSHLPSSLMLPIQGHTEQSKRQRVQLDASLPLKKKLWQQTIIAKIENQRIVLRKIGRPTKRLDVLIKRVMSGDPENIEGQAAAYYWSQYLDGFIRDRYGDPPNNLLNYGYAILRAMVARGLCSSGLNLTMGIHHRNKYNAYCLADDIMEPFRPFVDLLVHHIYSAKGMESFLEKESKREILSIAQADALYGKIKRPLMVGISHTTASLYKCFAGEKRKIIYPLIL